MSLLDPIEDRGTAILCTSDQLVAALGLTGHGPAIAPPAGRFRPSLHGAPLDDPGYDVAAFDRAIYWEWQSSADEPAPTNSFEPASVRAALVDLQVGYLYGDALEAFVSVAPGTSEDAATAVRHVRRRALGEAEDVREAMLWLEFWANLDPAVGEVHRESESTLRDLGGGKLLCVTRYRIVYQRDTSHRYDP